jgi:hypothetical protein
LSAVLGSLLGLLALLLSFTFAMSAARYDARRQLVVKDANQLTNTSSPKQSPAGADSQSL